MVEEKEGAREKGLKPTQVAASALAAVTAAFLGSTLGVEGTVAGAGIASVVTTLGGEVYLRSLRKTRATARKARETLVIPDTRLRQETRVVEPPPTRPVNPLFRPDDPTVRLPQPTQAFPAAGQGQSNAGDRTVLFARPEAGEPKPKRPWWKSRWMLAAGTSVVAFLVGMLVLTGFETVTGQAVSGGSSNTVSQLTGGGSDGSSTTTVPSTSTTVTETRSRGTATSTTRTAAPSSTAKSTPTSESAPSRTSSSAPSVTTTESASPTSG